MPRNSCCEMRVTQCMTCLTNSNQSQHTDTVLTQAPPVSINMPITFIIFHILHLITSSWSFFTLLEHYGVMSYNVKIPPVSSRLSDGINIISLPHTESPVSGRLSYIFHNGCTLHCSGFPQGLLPSGRLLHIFHSECISPRLHDNKKQILY